MTKISNDDLQVALETKCEDARKALNSVPIVQFDSVSDGGLMENYQTYRAALSAYQNAKAELDAFMAHKKRQSNRSDTQQ